MSDFKTIPVELELRFFPDEYTDAEKAEGASWPLGAGYFEYGVQVGEHFVPFGRFKGGQYDIDVDKLAAAAKDRRAGTIEPGGDVPTEPMPEPPTPAEPTS